VETFHYDLVIIVVPPKKATFDEMHDYKYVNSMIVIKSPEKSPEDKARKTKNLSTSAWLPLNATQHRDNIYVIITA